MNIRLVFGLILVAALTSCAGRVTSDNLILDDRVAIIVQSDMSDDAKVESIRNVLEREQDQGANWTEIILNPAIVGILLSIAK